MRTEICRLIVARIAPALIQFFAYCGRPLTSSRLLAAMVACPTCGSLMHAIPAAASLSPKAKRLRDWSLVRNKLGLEQISFSPIYSRREAEADQGL